MATVPADVSGCLQTFETTLGRLEQQVTHFLQHISESPPEDPLQKAEAHAALARTITLLLEWYLRCEGINPAKHPVQNERKRMELYVKKVKKAAAEQQLSKLRPATALNVAAANRFIEHAIPDLTAEQRQRIKEVSRQHQQQHQQQQPQAGESHSGRAGKRPRPPSEARGGGRRGRGHREGSAKDAALAFLREAAAEAATVQAAPRAASPPDSGDSD